MHRRCPTGLLGDAPAMLPPVCDPDQVIAACTQALRPHALRLRGSPRRMATSLQHLQAGPLSINRLFYGADVTIMPAAPEVDDFLVSLPTAGTARFTYGGETVSVGPGHGAVVSPYREFRFDIDADFDQVVVRLDRRSVETIAVAVRGSAGAVPVDLDLSLRIPAGVVDGLLASAVALARTADTVQRDRLLRGVESLLAETLIAYQLLTAPPRCDSVVAAPTRVRSAMDFMLDRLGEPIGMSEVAAHCGVSLRSLQLAFRREVDRTPGQWLREARLDRAHALLRTGGPQGSTVTDVALSCGFLHLGEFAGHFRARFGSSPSAVRAGAG